MEDLVNFNSFSRSNSISSSVSSTTYPSSCTPSRHGIPPSSLPFETWSSIGSKRQIPEEPFSTSKRRKDADESSSSNKIVDSVVNSTIPSAPKTPVSSKKNHDRFIPNRSGLDIDFNFYQLTKPADSQTDVKLTPSQRKLKEELDHLKSGDNRRLVECRSTLTPQFDRVATPSRLGIGLASEKKMTPKRPPRTIPTAAVKTLDAPDLLNDYYLNLLHWGSSNILSIALGSAVYLWHPEDGRTESIVELEAPNAYVSSVQWSHDGKTLSVGTSYNTVQLWDVSRMSMIREMTGHQSRVSCLSWQSGDVLTSGGKDAMILNHDVRVQDSCFAYFSGHTQEVCGLSWSPSGDTLASGGNDNQLMLWDAAASGRSSSRRPMGTASQSFSPRMILDQHIAAVKAVAWCPWQRNILATGGGTADRTIRIWNTQDGANLQSVDTGSQVCAIQWSTHYKELVSSHGFSDNQLIVWKYRDMSKLQELRGHSARVLHLAKSPDDTTICSASADETLCFWNVFEKHTSRQNDGFDYGASPMPTTPGKRGLKSATKLLSTPSASLMIR